MTKRIFGYLLFLSLHATTGHDDIHCFWRPAQVLGTFHGLNAALLGLGPEDIHVDGAGEHRGVGECLRSNFVVMLGWFGKKTEMHAEQSLLVLHCWVNVLVMFSPCFPCLRYGLSISEGPAVNAMTVLLQIHALIVTYVFFIRNHSWRNILDKHNAQCTCQNLSARVSSCLAGW